MSGPGPPRLEEAARLRLLHLARTALARHLGAPPPAPAGAPSADLQERHGLFVTLTLRGDLVGCIGWLRCEEPLEEAVARCAIAAASADPRFPPVRAQELPQLRIEISVLSDLEPVRTIDEIEIGRDGLCIVQGDRRGLLLPQVAPEQGWGREELLAGVCRKAGLPPDAWRRGGSLLRFRATVFGEPRTGGEPVPAI